MNRKKRTFAVAFFMLLTIAVMIQSFGASQEPDNQMTLGISDNIPSPTEQGKNEALLLGFSGMEDHEATDVSPNLGWSSEELPLGASNEALFAAVPATAGDSIAGMINPADKTKVVILPSTTGTGYQAYDGTYAGLQQAVFELHQNGNQKDYILYIGSNITKPNTGKLTNRDIPSDPTADNVTFFSLQEKIGTLTLVGTFDDPLDTTTKAPADANTLTLGNNVYMGTNMVFRNIKYNAPLIFMEGNSITLDRGSYGLATTTIYGGTTYGTVQGNPTMEIYSTGNNTYSFYGGNRDGGSVVGHTKLLIHNTSGNIGTISGGGKAGSVNGSTTTIINFVSGNIGQVFGGAEGSLSKRAHVNGSVRTELHGLSGGLKTFYGGAFYGNVSGTITTIVDGVGSFTSPATFVGGSGTGVVGYSSIINTINTDVDTSQYTKGYASFAGGNRLGGMVRGNITNKVSAGDYNKGSFRYLYGGGDQGTVGPDVSLAELEALPLSERGPRFAQSAQFKVYGNISTEITGGSIGWEEEPGWTRGAGYAGYVEGDVTLKVGTERLAYSGNRLATADLTPSTTNKTRGYNTNFDIVAGGGSSAKTAVNTMYIKGNTTLIQENVLARWTYGGSFSGLVEGTARNELHNGVVDTLEGAGFEMQRLYGNSIAVLYGGQVDWFITGGGWNDFLIDGDVSTEVHGGTINAALGGTFGSSTRHAVTGNSSVTVTGGNFSGTSRGSTVGFAAGPLSIGKILGNASLTLDFRTATEPFVPPTDTFIVGGRPQNSTASAQLGTNKENYIDVNIFTGDGNDVLKDVAIYGDSGAGNTTKSGTINFTIDAPNSAVGRFYTTSYLNFTGGKLLRSSNFNIKDAKEITVLSGGSRADGFKTPLENNTDKYVKMVFNNEKNNSNSHKTIEITEGVLNFTDVIINNATLRFTTGKLLNGKNATASMHGTNFHNFGDITLKKKSSLYFGESSHVNLSGNVLKILDGAQLESPSSATQILVSDIEFGPGAKLEWKRNGGTPTSSRKGTWFGNTLAYDVMTFSPLKANATKLTPENFSGLDGTTLLLGDNTAEGYAIAVASTSTKFKVVEGQGTIHHNVETGSGQGVASVEKNIPVRDGWILVPSKVTDGALTFTPDVASGSWLKKAVIKRSDGVVTTIPEQENEKAGAVSWNISPNTYHYEVEVYFANTPEITGHSALIREKEANQMTTAKQVDEYLGVKGRPFFTSNIDEALLAEIRKPLEEGQRIRYHSISYSVGKGSSLVEKTYQLGVVKDSATISFPTKEYALDARDVVMTLSKAQTITEEELNSQYTFPVIYQADTTATLSPSSVADQVQSRLNGLTAPDTVQINYRAVVGGFILTKSVKITVLPDGALKFNHVPELNFGTLNIPTENYMAFAPQTTYLAVEDSRGASYGSDWKVEVEATPLVSSGNAPIPASYLKYANNNATIGPVGIFPLDTPTVIWESATNSNNVQNLNWTSDQSGFFVDVDPGIVSTGRYHGTVTWTLSQVP